MPSPLYSSTDRPDLVEGAYATHTHTGDEVTSAVASANRLATARTIQTNLGSTSAASFNGSANVTPGVTGVLPVANGGTGATGFQTETSQLIYYSSDRQSLASAPVTYDELLALLYTQSQNGTVEGDGGFYFWRVGKVCMYSVSGSFTGGAGAWGTQAIAQLDTGLEPVTLIRMPMAVQAETVASLVLYIDTTGEVTVRSRGTSSGWGNWAFTSGAYYVA